MYWDPFEELERMHEEIERLFRRSFYGWDRPLIGYEDEKGLLVPRRGEFMRTPVCHLQETESNIIATFELPGVQKSDIDLNVTDNSIELKVESKQEKKHEEKDRKAYMYTSQSFYRRVPLPKEVDADKSTAEYKDGILRVEMPKKEKDEKKGKKLLIK